MLRAQLGLTLVVMACWLLQPVSAQKKAERERSQPASLWKDPGDVSRFDFAYGPGGAENAPAPPFYFVEEDKSGSTPKVTVRDANERIWSVKWGFEAPAEVFATKLVWAAGYWVQPAYFVAEGRILNARNLEATAHVIDEKTGAFTAARFEPRDEHGPKFLKDAEWDWQDNPFAGSHELAGLKILMMLTSNWDAKESNTAIFEDARQQTFLYVFADWGAAMGKWGGVAKRAKWHCEGYAAQTAEFSKGIRAGRILWGFEGKNQEAITAGITVENVRWVMRYLGRISDDQLRAGLRASGATAEEVECFTAAVRNRIEQLRKLAGAGQRAQRHTPGRASSGGADGKPHALRLPPAFERTQPERMAA